MGYLKTEGGGGFKLTPEPPPDPPLFKLLFHFWYNNICTYITINTYIYRSFQSIKKDSEESLFSLDNDTKFHKS